ncbi:hypothetical protein J5X07_10680 [Actinomyces bowdenii]|uniref:EccD-like transmembrane domain-containing protein n=1 Tax=Actinomyces bowdenii TaxID=131109 RepID=A0A3P1UND1_9ACTO|nr:EsaB/YukD family protein [Actinomyces bowdenii]MBO3725482.1 hypothetical protein [Actinomyces bowdenii]RRD22685.1 hypothetical protein EII10_12535 [Actinomyces bowdenii]
MPTRPPAPGSSPFVPVTVVHEGVALDVTLPSGLPVVEILPVLAERLGGLGPDALAYGLCLARSAGAPLDPSRSLEGQQVTAGTMLTLEQRLMDTEPRYDDLVEAVAVAVSQQQTAWQPRDAASMSIAATCVLFITGGFMLMQLNPSDWFVPLSAGIATAILCLATYAIAQAKVKGAWAVAITAGVLSGMTFYAGAQGAPMGWRLVMTGAGAAAALCVCGPALGEARPMIGGPLLVCLALVGTACGSALLGYSLPSVAAIVCALAASVSLLAPWVSLASVPMVISLPEQPMGYHRAESDYRDSPSLTARVMSMQGLVLSVRVACSVIVLACTPILASSGADGVILVAVIAAAGMLGTRAVRSKADVAAGVVGGMLILAALVLVVTVHYPEFITIVVVVSGVIGLTILVLNVLGPSYRPRLARAADALEIIAIASIGPLTALVVGVL